MNKDTPSMTWEEARTYCQHLGPGISLAEIHNQHTQVMINDAAKALGVGLMTNSGWWLGSNEINDLTSWKWDYTGITHTYVNFVIRVFL